MCHTYCTLENAAFVPLCMILLYIKVTALNKEGVSPPIRTLDPVKAENPYVAPGNPTGIILDYSFTIYTYWCSI